MRDVENRTPKAGPARRLLVLAIKFAVSIGLLAVLFGRIEISRLWVVMREASMTWLLASLCLYLVMILISAWRWRLLLNAQHVAVSGARLVNSYLVATFFNNFLPSNIGGDVIRIADTAPASGSKTLATTVVLMDRGIGLLGLVLVAAVGASSVSGATGMPPWFVPALWIGFAVGAAVVVPVVLKPHGVAKVLNPLRRIHQEWVSERIARLTSALARFGESPQAMVWGFAGAVATQAVLVGFYAAIVRSMGIPLAWSHLAVLVPLSFIVQMAPVSVNGFGVREATFSVYFSRLGLPIESAIAVSFMGAVLIMVFSLSGAVAYLTRGSSPPVPAA